MHLCFILKIKNIEEFNFSETHTLLTKKTGDCDYLSFTKSSLFQLMISNSNKKKTEFLNFITT